MLTNTIDPISGFKFRSRTLSVAFSNPRASPMQRSTLTELLTALGTILGAGFGVKLLSGWRSRKSQGKMDAESTNELTMKIIDEGDSFRAVLMEDAREARKELDIVRERAHQAELKLIQAEAKISLLEAELNIARSRSRD